MELTIPTSDGDEIRFECADTGVSQWVCTAILEGKTYPILPEVTDVRVVADIGANCGAATVHLARAYPQATVHAIEPGPLPRALLERNVAGLPNVVVHPIGLSDHDDRVPLFRGATDSITGSVVRRPVNQDDSDEIELRHAGRWAAELGLDRLDVVKLDVEGCEVEVLEGLRSLLPTIAVLYVEYDSRLARRAIDDLVRDTHELYFAMMQALDQGECIYLRTDLAAEVDGDEQVRRIFGGG